MKPTVIVPTKLIPTTPNGKTDRVAVDKIPVPGPSNLNTTKKPTRALDCWENSIKEIWEEILSSRMAHTFERSQSRIDHNSDFFQVGGSSILMIKLKYLLEMQLGVKISMPELFHTSSLSSMAKLVADAKAAVNGTASLPTMPSFLGPKNIAQVIDRDLEIATIVDKLSQPRAIPSLSIESSLSCSEKLVVVLTGATGFIGKHLLSCLVQSPKVGQVHCVAIRPDASGKPRRVAVNSDKIVEYTGDLSDSNLGLSAAQFTFLAEHSHIIIHNGADVSLLKTYQSLRRANVISTRTLCSMAILRRLPVHYVSTASVAKVIQQKPLLEVPASPADADLLNSVDGYAASKWASEALLAKIAVESGIPVYIHRLAHVMGEDASELDAVGMMTKYSFLLHALPRIKEEAIEGQWDFVFVESVVDELVRSAMKSAIDYGHPSTSQSKREENRPAVFINHCNDVTIPHCKLKGYLEATSGEPLGEIELKEWLQLARETGMHPLIYEFFLAFEQGRGKMTLPMMSKTQRVIR
ncbi:hypothetical protein EYC80_010052 [Monilinia laxa]|uniref:Carrier domain-containing protein n=1 Tax=Monilinia laxa TaxID=61186 RepID=A0A5N6JRH9_MONLA|nr:hypothetical protein EYC80_010052 [Monilinia laxa]